MLSISEGKLANGPNIEVESNKLHDDRASLLIDTGSELNLLKESCIRGKLRRDKIVIYRLAGIGQGTYETRGSVQLEILGRTVKFHLVRDNFPISICGILGTEFLRENSATLKFENQSTTLDLPSAGTSSPCMINLPARSRKLIALPIVTTNLQDGYLRRFNAGTGVFLGESLVRPENGEVKVYAINTTLRDIEITIPPIKLEEIEILETSIGNISSKRDKPNNKLEKQVADRLSRLLKIFDFSILNDKEKSSLLGPITEFSHRFYLEGDILGSTDVISHEIHTTDETPIFHKQYRPAKIHNKEILNQTQKLLTDNFIENSDSPYNSPVWVVLKKNPTPTVTNDGDWSIGFRKLNEKTVKDAYPLPNITYILDQLGGAQYFSTLDLAMSFHQIKMHPNSKAQAVDSLELNTCVSPVPL